MDALRKITVAEGLAGLWQGSLPAVQRAALVNLGELATYDQVRQTIYTSAEHMGWPLMRAKVAAYMAHL